MSNENKVRILIAENLRFPEEGSSSQGKSGPKPRTKVVGDGQQVKIPVPPTVIREKQGSRRKSLAWGRKTRYKLRASNHRQIRGYD